MTAPMRMASEQLAMIFMYLMKPARRSAATSDGLRCMAQLCARLATRSVDPGGASSGLGEGIVEMIMLGDVSQAKCVMRRCAATAPPEMALSPSADGPGRPRASPR